jgi:site-specific DNA-methyltransferase (adenine-specific)
MVTLLKGDCLKVMASLPDKSISAFICDLPYGQLAGGYDRPGDSPEKKKKIANQTKAKCAWDVKIDLVEFWKQVKRLCKDDHTPVLMFCNTKFGIDLVNSNPSWFRYDLVWDKGHGVSFLLANKMPMKSHEMVYVFSKKGAFYRRVDVKTDKKEYVSGLGHSTQYGVNKISKPGGKDGMRCPLSVIHIGGKLAGGHPTEKPKELYEWLLSRYVPDNGTVLDPTAGSFNSILVAKKLGYKAIGIEMDTGFFWKGVAKLK